MILTPSPQWTPDERLRIIGILAAQTTDSKRPPVYFDLERIRFVAIMPSTFLEEQRRQILEGTGLV